MQSKSGSLMFTERSEARLKTGRHVTDGMESLLVATDIIDAIIKKASKRIYMIELDQKKLPFTVRDASDQFNLSIVSRLNNPDLKRDDHYVLGEQAILDGQVRPDYAVPMQDASCFDFAPPYQDKCMNDRKKLRPRKKVELESPVPSTFRFKRKQKSSDRKK